MTPQTPTDKFERDYRTLMEAFRTPPRLREEYAGDVSFATQITKSGDRAIIHKPDQTRVSETFYKGMVQTPNI